MICLDIPENNVQHELVRLPMRKTSTDSSNTRNLEIVGLSDSVCPLSVGHVCSQVTMVGVIYLCTSFTRVAYAHQRTIS